MLFSGLACFSPSVVPAIRKLWVKNGGRLTHTDADFRRADFFFCDGMSDPWLKDIDLLLSRSLIVRHAAWVALCVVEAFVMPIAAYTLDDGFDESTIVIFDPSEALQQDNVVELSPLQRKRAFDHDGDSQHLVMQQRHKKARIGEPPPSLLDASGDRTLMSSQSDRPAGHANIRGPMHTATDVSLSIGETSRIISFGKRNKVSQAVRVFENLIAHPKTLSPPPTPQKMRKKHLREKQHMHTIPSPLNPHTLFWNDLLVKAYARDREPSGPLRLKIDELLDAPTIKAGIFTVNKNFFGKMFVNKDYVVACAHEARNSEG